MADIVERYVNRSIIDLDGLNEWQRAAIVLLATKREHRMSYEAIADELGITPVTLYRFRQREDVKDYILRYSMARIIDRIPEIVEVQADNAINKGSVKSAELILKYAGQLVERRAVDANVTATGVISDKDNDALADELAELRKRIDGEKG